MNGYLLIWILLQKIEKLEEELNTYKNNKKKTDFQFRAVTTCSVFMQKKNRYVSLPHIWCCLMNGYVSLKLLLLYYFLKNLSNNFISKLFTVCPKYLLLALSCPFPWQQSRSIQTPFKSCGKSNSQQCVGQNYREQAEYNPHWRRCIFFQGPFYFN